MKKSLVSTTPAHQFRKSHIDTDALVFYTVNELNNDLQGRVQFPTGGIAHEPQGMIR